MLVWIAQQWVVSIAEQSLQQAAGAFPWQQQALFQVFGGRAQEDIDMTNVMLVTLGAAPACVPAVKGLILPIAISSHKTGVPDLLGSGTVAGAAAALPSAPCPSSCSMDRALQAEVPQMGCILHPSLWGPAAAQIAVLHCI